MAIPTSREHHSPEAWYNHTAVKVAAGALAATLLIKIGADIASDGSEPRTRIEEVADDYTESDDTPVVTSTTRSGYVESLGLEAVGISLEEGEQLSPVERLLIADEILKAADSSLQEMKEDNSIGFIVSTYYTGLSNAFVLHDPRLLWSAYSGLGESYEKRKSEIQALDGSVNFNGSPVDGTLKELERTENSVSACWVHEDINGEGETIFTSFTFFRLPDGRGMWLRDIDDSTPVPETC